MAIGSDFSINYTTKRVYHSSGTTLYTVNEFYSWLMDQFDELSQMDDDVPISAQTPTEYTMENGWFIDDVSTQFLYGGAIKTNGYANVIHVLKLSSSGYTNYVSGDLDTTITDDSTAVGPLLAYDNTRRVIWVRETRGSFTAIASGSDIDAGTTTNNTAADDSTSGEDLFPNIYTLGTISTTPQAQIYVFQNGERIAEWWDRATFDGFSQPEHIDVLVKVKEAGVEIAGAVVTVFNRQYGDLFDHFEIDLTNGGRNAVPLSTASDLNNTTGELYLELQESDLSGLTVGLFVRGETSGAVGEIMEVDDTNDYVYLGNVTGGPFQTSETIAETTDGTSGGDTASDYTNDAATAYTNVVAAYGGAGKILVYHVSGRLDFTGGGTGTDPALYETVTGGTNSATGVLLELEVTSGTFAGGDAAGWMILGNVVGSFEGTGGDAAESLSFSGGRSATVSSTHGVDPTYVTTARAFSLQSDNNYNCVIDLNGDNVTDLYEYVKYLTREGQEAVMYPYNSKIRMIYFESSGYVSCVESDIGLQVLGGTSGDTGTLVAYNNGTRVWTVLMDACTGTPANDDLFDVRETVQVTTAGGTGTGTSIGASSPGSVDGQEYQRAMPQYALSKASPLGTLAGGVYFGAQGVWIEDMHADDANSYQLIDHSGTTQTPPAQIAIKVTSVESGDTVGVFPTTGDNYIVNKSQYNIQDTISASESYIRVEENIPNDTPASGFVRVVRRDANGIILGEERYAYTDFDNSNQPTYSDFNLSGTTTQAYDTDDTAYVPYLDEDATGTEVAETVQYVSPRYVVARVRRYNGAGDSIIPFQTKGQILSSGYSTAAIRTEDNIVS